MSTVFGSTQSHSSPTSHRAQIPSSSHEVSSDGSELEFARSNDDDDDSSLVGDQPEQGGGVRGRVCLQPRRRGRGRRPGRACGRDGRGTSSQAMCGMGITKGYGRDTSGITQDQLILNGPWQRKENNALNYFWLYFAIFIYWNESFLHLYNVFVIPRCSLKSLWLKSVNLQMYKTFYHKIYLKIEQ